MISVTWLPNQCSAAGCTPSLTQRSSAETMRAGERRRRRHRRRHERGGACRTAHRAKRAAARAAAAADRPARYRPAGCSEQTGCGRAAIRHRREYRRAASPPAHRSTSAGRPAWRVPPARPREHSARARSPRAARCRGGPGTQRILPFCMGSLCTGGGGSIARLARRPRRLPTHWGSMPEAVDRRHNPWPRRPRQATTP